MVKKNYPRRIVISEKYLISIKKLCKDSPKFRDPKQFVELAVIDKLKKEGIKCVVFCVYSEIHFHKRLRRKDV